MDSIVQTLTAWWKRPLNLDADGFSLVLTLGLITIALYWWHIVIKHIEPVGE